MNLRPPTELWAPKAGNALEEYEDAYRVAYEPADEESVPTAARIAVADGATESAFAKEWANLLVDAFVNQPPELCGLTEDSLNEWLQPSREQWRGCVPWDRLPWHGEAKARAGAFATLLGLIVSAAPGDNGRLSWQAVAVGDCCFFVVRDDRLLLSFPLDEASHIDNNPALICSHSDNAGVLWEGVSVSGGECAAGDLLILASDALACWFLAGSAAWEKPWEALAALDSSSWNAWIEEQRGAGLLHNDDTTLVMIEVV